MKFIFIKIDDYKIGQAVEFHGEGMYVHHYVYNAHFRESPRRKGFNCKNFYAMNHWNGNLTLCICTDSPRLLKLPPMEYYKGDRMKIMTGKFTANFMADKPEEFDKIVNQLGQTVIFYEHPTNSDDTFIYCLINGRLADTRFMDTADFYEDSEYMPCLFDDGRIDCYCFENYILTY